MPTKPSRTEENMKRLLSRLQNRVMNARDCSDAIHMSYSGTLKYLKVLQERGDVVIDHVVQTPYFSRESSFYRAASPEEKAEYRLAKQDDKPVVNVSVPKKPSHTPGSVGDPLLWSLFGRAPRPKRNTISNKGEPQ
jgi:hypothetical protein